MQVREGPKNGGETTTGEGDTGETGTGEGKHLKMGAGLPKMREGHPKIQGNPKMRGEKPKKWGRGQQNMGVEPPKKVGGEKSGRSQQKGRGLGRIPTPIKCRGPPPLLQLVRSKRGRGQTQSERGQTPEWAWPV